MHEAMIQLWKRERTILNQCLGVAIRDGNGKETNRLSDLARSLDDSADVLRLDSEAKTRKLPANWHEEVFHA